MSVLILALVGSAMMGASISDVLGHDSAAHHFLAENLAPVMFASMSAGVTRGAVSPLAWISCSIDWSVIECFQIKKKASPLLGLAKREVLR